MLPRHQAVFAVLIVVASPALSPVSAFNAQFPRPYVSPLLKTTSLEHRKRRWVSLYSTASASTHGKESEDEASSLHKDEENTILPENNDDTSSLSSRTVDRQQPTVRSSLRLLFGMSRPSNFPGVVLLHILGTYLALQSPLVENAQLWPTLAQPSMMIVLVCLLLTSAASMVVSDESAHKMSLEKSLLVISRCILLLKCRSMITLTIKLASTRIFESLWSAVR